MKMNMLIIVGIIASCLVYSTAGAQDTSTRLFNVYTHSAVSPEKFDHYVAQHPFDNQIRSCINNLSATYVPIAEKHLNLCWGISDWTTKRNCMSNAPPEAHVGDWLASLQLTLTGTPWCNTSTGWSACVGKQMVGPVLWDKSVRPYFPLWRQYLQCK